MHVVGLKSEAAKNPTYMFFLLALGPRATAVLPCQLHVPESRLLQQHHILQLLLWPLLLLV